MWASKAALQKADFYITSVIDYIVYIDQIGRYELGDSFRTIIVWNNSFLVLNFCGHISPMFA